MRNAATHLSGPSHGAQGHQELALAVIVQAINDAKRPTGKLRHEAQHFLTTDAMLAQWCGVAGLDADFVRSVIRKSIERSSRRLA